MERVLWEPASGHPSGRWRVVRNYAKHGLRTPDGAGLQELERHDGSRPILFGSASAARRRADRLNRLEG